MPQQMCEKLWTLPGDASQRQHFFQKPAARYACKLLKVKRRYDSFLLCRMRSFWKTLLALFGLADPNLRTAYGSIQAMFRAGTNPTGIRAISFIDLMSTTETLFDCSFAT